MKNKEKIVALKAGTPEDIQVAKETFNEEELRESLKGNDMIFIHRGMPHREKIESLAKELGIMTVGVVSVLAEEKKNKTKSTEAKK